MQRNPEAVAAFRELGHEIACHGLRWKSYQLIDRDTERVHMAEAVQILQELTGAAPLGWYTGRDSPHTRELVVEHGGFVYDSDSYADDLPYWVRVHDKDHLVVPYTLDTNDMRFASAGRVFQRRGILRTPSRRLRRALRGRLRRRPEDALDRSALPAGRPSGAHGGARAVL